MADKEKRHYVIKKRLGKNDVEFVNWPDNHGIDLEKLQPNQKFVEVRIMPPREATSFSPPIPKDPLYGILYLKIETEKLVYFNEDKDLVTIDDPKKIIYDPLNPSEQMDGGKRRYRRSSNKRKSSKKSRKSKRKSKRTSRR